MYKDYLNALKRFNKLMGKLPGKEDEMYKLTLSDDRWVNDRFEYRKKDKFLKGEIYQFEFGKNYIPEMSYEHRGLVIGVNKKLLYVMPIYSFNNEDDLHKTAYHPVDNPDEKQDLFLMKNTEFCFLEHDSVLKLNDLRTVSVNRMIRKYKFRMDIDGDIYRKIEDLVIQKYFNQFHYQYSKLKKDYDNLQNELESTKNEKNEVEKKMNEYILLNQALKEVAATNETDIQEPIS